MKRPQTKELHSLSNNINQVFKSHTLHRVLMKLKIMHMHIVMQLSLAVVMYT